jgi:hypothetical protein
VGYRDWKKGGRFRWHESVSERHERRTDAQGPPFIRHISWFTMCVPPKGFPGFLMAALPFVLAIGFFYPAWRELLVIAAVVALIVVVLLRRSPG